MEESSLHSSRIFGIWFHEGDEEEKVGRKWGNGWDKNWPTTESTMEEKNNTPTKNNKPTKIACLQKISWWVNTDCLFYLKFHTCVVESWEESVTTWIQSGIFQRAVFVLCSSSRDLDIWLFSSTSSVVSNRQRLRVERMNKTKGASADRTDAPTNGRSLMLLLDNVICI